MSSKIIDNYSLFARIIPAIITSLPFLLLWYYLTLDRDFKNILLWLSNVKFYGSLGLSIVFLFLYGQIIRYSSKYIENKLFSEFGYPTTYLLLYSNSKLSNQTKDNYRRKIHEQYKLKLLNPEEEKKAPLKAKKLISESTNYILPEYRSDKLVHNHNILYGFWRNIIGGCIYSIIFCLINIALSYYVFKSEPLTILSIILLFIFSLIFLLKHKIIKQSGEQFAEKLIFTFLSNTKS